MQKRKATIHDIASQLNMSASTVSRALNSSGRISSKTRELVKQTAVRLNYKPNQLAMNLRKGKGTTIGVIIPRLNRHFFSHAIAGMESITNPTNYNLMICQTNEDYESEKRSLQSLLDHRVDGIIMSIANGTRKTEHIETAMHEGIPLVLFDRTLDNLEADQVLNDNYSGAYEATSHLIGQGYRSIYHFSGPMHVTVYRDRYNGYYKAMKDAGIEPDDSMVFKDVLTRAKGEEVARQLIEYGNMPDAIFAASDFSALGVLLACKEKGIKIPEQLGIAGFANEPFTEFIEPGLTTLEQYSEEIGKSAARMLINRMENGLNPEVPNTVVFKPRLIIRGSTMRMKNTSFNDNN